MHRVNQFPVVNFPAVAAKRWIVRNDEEDDTIITWLRATGQRSGEPVSLCYVVDDSSSEESTDRYRHRYVAARRLALWIAYAATTRPRRMRAALRRPRATGHDDLISVVHFAHEPHPILSPTPAGLMLDRINRSLHPATSGGTAIAPAIGAAARLHPASHRSITIVFSDGGTNESFADIAAAIRLHPDESVHAVLFDV
jgi:hypothetical protein